jgi:hypothetical protein
LVLGRWQYFHNEAVTFDLDFIETSRFKEVQVGFSQNACSWILRPSKVEEFLDGKMMESQWYFGDAFAEGNF